MTVRIIVGDCRERLKELADESVHCCVTSPPYFGLRDYGTGTWDGGDGRSRLDFFNDAGRNKRSVWTVIPEPFSEAHFATFPPALIEPCILAGCPTGGVVLDPFGGAGTTGLVADRLQRDSILIELNPEYAEIAAARLRKDGGLFAQVAAA